MRKRFLITRWLLRSSLTTPRRIATLEMLWLLRGRMRKRFLITRWLLNSTLTTPKHITTWKCFVECEGMTEEAIDHYKMAIKLKPDFADAHYNLGNTLLNKGRTSEAISHYKMAIKIKPDFALAHYNLEFGAALFRWRK